MNKRRIALLAGLMTMGMVSFAMDESDAEVLTKAQKPLSIFNISDRVRFDENRMEINGNFHFNENNRLEMRVRNDAEIGSELGESRESGHSTTDKTEIRLRLYTQTSVDNLEVRTELKTNTYDSESADMDNSQYFRVQPTLHLFNDVEGLSSLVRAGLGMNHTSENGENFSFTSSFENYYTINDYFAVEGNVYYDYTFASNSNKYHSVDIEAYAYANYPIYNANDIKVEALFEGGFDPYSFGNRHFGDLDNVNGETPSEGHETYVLYAEPSVKATKTLSERNSIYLQGGYYVEQNNDNSTGEVDDTAFVRVGFTSKF